MTKCPTFLLQLIAFDLIISGVVSATINVFQRYELFFAISLLSIFAGSFCIWVATKPTFVKKFEIFISGQFGNIICFIPSALISLFLFSFEPNKTVVLLNGPLLLSVWLIGPQLIWFSNQRPSNRLKEKSSQGKRLSLLTLLFALSFLLIPSRIPSLLSGMPIDQRTEFIVTVILLPAAWIINERFFSKKVTLILLLALLIIKSLICAFLPQAGLRMQVFTSLQAISHNQWQPTYTTWLNTSYSTIMQSPYKSIREFPVEWVNNRLGFDFDQFWMTLEINGTIHLYDDGRPVFMVRGAKQAQFEMTASDTHTKAPLLFVDDLETLDSNFYRQLPDCNSFDLRGTILYTKFGEARLEPVLLYPDGSIKPLFENAGVWSSQTNMLPQGKVIFLEILLNLLSITFITIIIVGIIHGFTNLYTQNQLSRVDIYLIFSSLIIYYLASTLEKPQVPFFITGTIAVVALIKTLDFKFDPTRSNLKSYIVFVGTIFLFGYLALDVNNLRSIATLPPAQDGLEYQTFARNIFVYGDVFLAQTPPRAYKVLFPYVVGLLHTIFGQSTASQFVLNAWCAILSAALIFILAQKLQLSLQNALLTSISFLIILCMPSSYIYYFRFGLIEPIAILCLLATLLFALERQINKMRFVAILTVLFRLDYLGIVLTAIILTCEPVIGGMEAAWSYLLRLITKNVKDIIFHILIVISPSAFIIISYFLFIPGYMLNASDVEQSSLFSILEGFMRVLTGGNFSDFQEKISQGSFEFLLILIPLATGLIISLLSILRRRGVFAKIDLRFALLVPAILPAYIAVRPAAYFPRFSFPILVLDLLLIGMFLYHIANNSKTTSNWKSE